MGYPDKYSILQMYANDERVETICEIGFNSGYSTLFMTLQNPKAKFIEFDIFYHNYSAVALSALQEFFPDRDFIGVAGDSSDSVTRFHRMFPDVTCNLLFIDGGHSTETLRDDIENMMLLANRSYHRVIVDDTPEGNNQYEEYFKFVVINVSEDSTRSMYVDSNSVSGKSHDDGIVRNARLRHIAQYNMNTTHNPCFSWEYMSLDNPLHGYVTMTDILPCIITSGTSEFYDAPSGVSVGQYLFDINHM